MVGCFSVSAWCRKLPTASRDISESSSEVQCVKDLDSKAVSAVPTAKDYALGTASEIIHVLQLAINNTVSVPGAQQVLQLALGLIQTCQAVSDIGDKVKELKIHVESIMRVVVRNIERTSAKTIPWDLVEDIDKLAMDFEAIKRDLDSIAAQNRLLVAFFKTANKAKVDRCNELLKQSLIHWETSRGINQTLLLSEINQKLAKTANEVSGINKSLHLLNQQVCRVNYNLSHEIPPPPAILYGRDAFVEDVVNLLVYTSPESEPLRICIHAQGGMGKTSVALAVMAHSKILDKFGPEGRFWVPCVLATSPALFLQLLYDNFRIKLDTGDPLADIMRELNASTSPRLVLLDNFETPWDSAEGGREDVEYILNRLASISHLSVLVTMRTNTPPTEQIAWIDRPLDVVDPETSYSIYCAIHPAAKGKPQLRKLLLELGHMPFAVTVVAKLGKTSKSMPSTLLKRWREGGLGMLQVDGEKEDSISRSISLSMSSKTMVNNVAAHTLLATLAVLAAGTTHSHMGMWAPQLGTKLEAAISALNNVALIVDIEQSQESEDDADSDVSIMIHPVVRSYMRQDERIPTPVLKTVRKACCEFIFKHQSSPGDVNFKDDLQAFSTEEVNLQSVLLDAIRDNGFTRLLASEIEEVLRALIVLAWYQHWTKPRTDVIEQTLEFARRHGYDNCISESLFCLGSTLLSLDKYHEACAKFTEAQGYFRKLSNTLRVCECSFKLSNTYKFLSNGPLSKHALDDLSEEDLGPIGGNLRARKNMARGEYFRFIGAHPEALACFKAAKEVFEMERCWQVDLARCLYYMGGILGRMLEFQDGLEAINRSLDICEKLTLTNDLVESLITKGSLLLYTEAHIDEVLPTLERSLEKALLLGGPLCIGQALELHGELYAREGKVLLAIKFYQAAKDQYRTITPESDLNTSRCQANLDRLATASNPEGEVAITKVSVNLL